MLCFYPRISPLQISISYRLLPPHSVLCCLRKPHKTLKSGGNANDQHKKAHRYRTDSSHPHNCLHCPCHGSGDPDYPGEQLQGQYLGGGRAQRPDHRPQRYGLHRHLQQPRHGGGGADTVLLGGCRQGGGERRDHRLQQRRGMREIRQEMIQLINQTQKANGVPELPVSEALMNAAQVCSNRRYIWHHAPEEGQAAVDAGYHYGFGDNLPVFTGPADAARRAVDNWINSPRHFETMIAPRCDCIGVGVTQHGSYKTVAKPVVAAKGN